MTILRVAAAFLSVAWVTASGCAKKTPLASEKEARDAGGFGSLVVGKDERAIAELKADDVIVAVNGAKFTRRMYDALIRSIEEAYRLNNPKADPLAVEMYRQRREKSLVSEFLTKQTLLAEAHRMGLSTSAENRASVFASLEPFAKKKGMTVDELGKSSDPADTLVYEGAKDQALILTLRQAVFGDKLKVTEADRAAALERIKNFNEMSEKTNALVKARAEAICDRLRGGEDFFKVARETTEEKPSEEGIDVGVWGTFVRDDIEDAAVQRAAFVEPVGSFAGPFDTREGMVIIKVLERKGIDSLMATEEATVKLGRIILRMAETAEVPDGKTLNVQLEKDRLQSLQRPWLAELQKKVRVEYPHGTNLFKKAKSR